MWSNPRAFNWEKLLQSRNKVTLGFKCQPELKIQLAEEAEEAGLTLSEYTEEVLLARQRLENENDRLHHSNSRLLADVAFYEGGMVKKLFESNRGKEIEFVNLKNEREKLLVNTPKDVFRIMTSSFKNIEND